jgi:hypothetical protein
LSDALMKALARIRLPREREAEALVKIGRQREEFSQRLATEESQREELRRQLAEAENMFARERLRLTAIWDDLAAQLKAKLQIIGEWEFKYRDLERTLSNQLAATQRKYDTLRDRWEQARIDDLEHPDGKVIDVNGRLRVATINLGRSDLLPRGQQFSVYDASAARVKGAKRKGTIEVLRIVDDHTSEAKITSDSVREPILPGDQIHTPAWQPGQARHFALVAPLDFDGDGKSDYQTVRNLVLASGGVIDAEVDEQGQRTGELSVETRYVIIGAPARKVETPRGEHAARLLDEAKQFGVDPISVGKFFDLVGYTPPARVVKYGQVR